MDTQDTPRFMGILAKTMGGYAKPLPDAEMVKVWIDWLTPYPIRVIAIAFAEYCNEESRFPPTPAGIAMRCKALDGRPDAEEAWAMALISRDEAVTVVWTSEMAEAFAICRPVLETGDEVGARMAFKEAYRRLVSAARIRNLPTKWNPSLGWDAQAMTIVLEKAVRDGHLAIENVTVLLPAPTSTVDSESEKAKARENLQKIKEMLKPISEKRREARERDYQAERDALMSAKKEAANRVRDFENNKKSPS